jgi:integrase
VHRIVSEIIADGWPETISGQKLNDHVKTLGKLAGLKEKVMFARTEGGTRVTHVKEKWEMITSHTARRSFATNLFMRNVPAPVIRAVTGHKSEREFLKYIKAAPEQISRMLADYDVWS